MAGRLKRGMVWLGLWEPDEHDLEGETHPRDQRDTGAARAAPATALRRVRDDGEQRERDRYDEPVEAVVRPIPSPVPGKVHLVEPAGFNDAEEIGEKFKADIPVIVNLQGMDNDVSKRLIDFAAGLTFGLHGRLERVTAKVFLLSPHNVSVTAQDKARIENGFFNQS